MCFLSCFMLIMACETGEFYAETNDQITQDIGETTLFNDCVLTEASGEIPSDLYAVTSPVATNEYGQFGKVMKVYGITLVAKQDVSDAFLLAVGQAIVDMFPSDASDLSQQQEILRNLHQYNALIPVFAGGEAGFTHRI